MSSVEPDARGGASLRVFAPTLVAEGVEPKDSISVSGACLTVVACDTDSITFDVVPETLRRTNLGALRAGDAVNVEASLRVGDRVGGHFVYGHVDTTVAIRTKSAEGQGYRIAFPRPPALARFIVEKGYVALDGVSLTIASVGPEDFDVALIPETAARTTLGIKNAGAFVNLEIDPLARYALSAASYDEQAGVRDDELAWAYEI